ncbi:P-loop NTPase [candidate division KSB1 bacterium]|nr:P-loop NTPase [candidate division KSB1 bacterium]
MSEIFVKINNQEKGPYSPRELKNLAAKGEFSQSDLVFHEDTQEWIEAGKIDELHEVFESFDVKAVPKTVFAVGGGKGGVGKTSLSASLGIGLAALDYNVVAIDADFGGANLHTCMGILDPEYSFYHFYTMQRESLQDIMLDTPIQNLKLISGACGTLGLANPQFSQKQRFIKQLHELNADFILLDLGAGSSYNVIDFFIAADQGILVTTPDPIAIQDTFNFLKVAFLRILVREFRNNNKILEIIDLHIGSNSGRMNSTIDDLIYGIEKENKEAAEKIYGHLNRFKPLLILNMVHANEEIKEGDTFKTAAKELLSIDVDYIGYIEYDDSVRNSLKELRPFILNNPKSKASKSLAKLISAGLLKKDRWQGFKEKRRVMKNVSIDSKSYPTTNLNESEIICSVKCFYWDDCEYQNGGHPCPIRHLDPIFRR